MSKLGSIASKIYGAHDKGVQTLLPRSKFQFYVTIFYKNPDKGGVLDAVPFERIASMDMPGHSAKTTTLNQYNKKRIVQTGVEYNPVNLVAYDTRDAYVEKFLSAYHAYYFRGVYSPHGVKKYEDDILAEQFVNDINSGTSYAGLQAVQDKNFIDSILIQRVSSEEDSSFTIIHKPMISSVSVDTLEYSDSNPVQYRIEFQYEGYQTFTPTQYAEYKMNKGFEEYDSGAYNQYTRTMKDRNETAANTRREQVQSGVDTTLPKAIQAKENAYDTGGLVNNQMTDLNDIYPYDPEKDKLLDSIIMADAERLANTTTDRQRDEQAARKIREIAREQEKAIQNLAQAMSNSDDAEANAQRQDTMIKMDKNRLANIERANIIENKLTSDDVADAIYSGPESLFNDEWGANEDSPPDISQEIVDELARREAEDLAKIDELIATKETETNAEVVAGLQAEQEKLERKQQAEQQWKAQEESTPGNIIQDNPTDPAGPKTMVFEVRYKNANGQYETVNERLTGAQASAKFGSNGNVESTGKISNTSKNNAMIRALQRSDRFN